jgi:hypothetical protein
MPRASRMPRTRRLVRLHRVTQVVLLALLSVGVAVTKGIAGPQWWWPLLLLVAFAIGLIAVAAGVSKYVSARRPAAWAADRAELSAEERLLPYGVVQEGSDLLLPTKTGMVVLTATVTLVLLGLGVVMLALDDPAATALGVFLLLLGAWLATLTWWIRGTRVRITPEGIESTMGPRRFHTWIEVPEIKVDRAIVVVKAAGAPRPRIWIRCGLLEVSVVDTIWAIRKQRAW